MTEAGEPERAINQHGAPPIAPAHVHLDAKTRHVSDEKSCFRVAEGSLDIFVALVSAAGPETPQSHLIRLEAGDLLLHLPDDSNSAFRLRVIAVGAPHATLSSVLPSEIINDAALARWIAQLAGLLGSDDHDFDLSMLRHSNEVQLSPAERWRGLPRSLSWASITRGEGRLMGCDPSYRPGAPPAPLTAGMWIEAGDHGCTISISEPPDHGELWPAIDHLTRCAANCIRTQLAAISQIEIARLAERKSLTATMGQAALGNLAALVSGSSGPQHLSAACEESGLVKVCRLVAREIQATISDAPVLSASDSDIRGVVEFARANRLRVRHTLLRERWWKGDVGPLIAWYGEGREPVGLIRSKGHYTLFEGRTERRRSLTPALASELALDAVVLYPGLPARSLKPRDLLGFALPRRKGDIARLIASAGLIGLLSLATPLITEALVNSAIPRTEFDQLTFCAIALAMTALAMACTQAVQALGVLRIEALIDLRLQTGLIDRLLRLPTAAFRLSNVGDLANRALGIDAARRVLTGHTLASLFAGLFCWFGVGLMFYYDVKLAAVALILTVLRGLFILSASTIRVYYENRYRETAGKTEGLVLQLIAGIGKLRVSAATTRALAVWAKHFAKQKGAFLSSQRVANVLGAVEAAFPVLATLVIFAFMWNSQSSLLLNLGAFLAFFAAFGQTMAYVGTFATGLSVSLLAVPLLSRISPLTRAEAEVSEGRKPPGRLSGAVELSGVTFRYMPGGAPILENIRLRIAAGEYVAIVGPSGSGKSSLFRLLLGFELPEAGAIFYDGKALNTLDVTAVRAQIGAVLQTAQLTTGSVYDNICGGVQLPLEQAWEAAQLVGLEEDIKAMPMGMHTVIAEGINTFSGGQRQRIILARAMARHPRILLLDEATSALDNKAQAVVQNTLRGLDVTRVVIAHRLTTVREADRIVVLAGGKIVQEGTYSELMEARGLFSDFARRQLA